MVPSALSTTVPPGVFQRPTSCFLIAASSARADVVASSAVRNAMRMLAISFSCSDLDWKVRGYPKSRFLAMKSGRKTVSSRPFFRIAPGVNPVFNTEAVPVPRSRVAARCPSATAIRNLAGGAPRSIRGASSRPAALPAPARRGASCPIFCASIGPGPTLLRLLARECASVTQNIDQTITQDNSQSHTFGVWASQRGSRNPRPL
jgi:hypothetical protein